MLLKRKYIPDAVWYHTHVILAFGKLRHGGCREFKAHSWYLSQKQENENMKEKKKIKKIMA